MLMLTVHVHTTQGIIRGQLIFNFAATLTSLLLTHSYSQLLQESHKTQELLIQLGHQFPWPGALQKTKEDLKSQAT